MGSVTRLVKWSVAEHGFPSVRFPMRSLRVGGVGGGDLSVSLGGGLGIYTEVRAMEIERRCYLFALRRQNCTNLINLRTKCEVPTSQLKECDDNHQKRMCDAKGEVIAVTRRKIPNQASEGKPANPAGGRKKHRGGSALNVTSFSRHRSRIRGPQ